MADDPRVFLLSSPYCRGQEIPLAYARTRRDIPSPDSATEIAPGVRVALLGTGDFLLPSGVVGWGAQIVVWADCWAALKDYLAREIEQDLLVAQQALDADDMATAAAHGALVSANRSTLAKMRELER